MEGPTVKAVEKIGKKTREEKLKEQKIETEVLKSLNAIPNPDQKFQTLLHRCVEAERISRTALLQQKQNLKTIETLLLEKDNIATEYQRVASTKSKLESLCRELQSQNKIIKEDSLSKIHEEEERRKETQAKFQHSLNEIQKLMNENSEKNQKLEQDNQEMSGKFKHILTQYEEREKQMDRINKQMELVTQLNEAKLAKATIESLTEKEAFLKQAQVLEETISILKRQLKEAHASEKAYKAQVDLYSSKYGEFTKTFEGYKTDMTKMSKKTFKFEKEMLQWKIKYEKANSMLLDLMTEKQIRDEQINKTSKQLFNMQKLCRTLSAEKKAFYGKLVELNVEIPEVKVIQEEEPEPVVADKEKLGEMVKFRDELKKNLEQLHGPMQNTANNDKDATGKKSGKSKKSKKAQNGTKSEEVSAAAVTELKPTEEPLNEKPAVNGVAIVSTAISNGNYENKSAAEVTPMVVEAVKSAIALNEPIVAPAEPVVAPAEVTIAATT